MSRIFGLSFLRTELSNWNNGFDGRSRRDSEGKIFATDKARKYSIRQDLINAGHKVLIVAEKEIDSGKYMSLEAKLKKELGAKYTIKDIFETFIDVRLFGAVIAVKGNNFGFTGPVQILFAKDQYIDSNGDYSGQELYLDITSYLPGKSAEQTTIGKMNVLEKAFYAYPLIIDFNIYKKNILEAKLLTNENDIIDLFEKDIAILKESLSYDVTTLNSCSKMGSTNFFNIFITTKNSNDMIDLSVFQYQTYVQETENTETGKTDININLNNISQELIKQIHKIELIELKIPTSSKYNLTIQGLEKLEELFKDKIKKTNL